MDSIEGTRDVTEGSIYDTLDSGYRSQRANIRENQLGTSPDEKIRVQNDATQRIQDGQYYLPPVDLRKQTNMFDDLQSHTVHTARNN